ncbi:hypothetical protein N8621_02885 [Akkermansiaceae bacterium]|nr:hypothetical protein [Akkermansiaceae bacterium]
MQIPILRLGETYESADLVELNDNLATHTANPGLIRRDLLRINRLASLINSPRMFIAIS